MMKKKWYLPILYVLDDKQFYDILIWNKKVTFE